MKKFIKYSLMSLALLLSFSFMLVGCGPDEDQYDPNLYKLTLSANIDEVNEDDLKATFAYGCSGREVTEGTRDQDDIEGLKQAGATDADIAKVGKKQSDGSYYFFDGDPMYLEAPHVDGYIFLGFFDKILILLNLYTKPI